MNGNKFATGQILRNPTEVVEGRILAGGAQKPPEPCFFQQPPAAATADRMNSRPILC
jgi:hypothetical protein